MHKAARDQTGLVVIDIQEKLLPSIQQHEQVVANAVRLIKAAQVLRVPIIVTEQYPKGIGRTVEPVRQAIEEPVPIEKVAFSACGAQAFCEALTARQISDVILCGIEAHICVCQTALDLLDRQKRVFVVADAISSRTPENKEIALRRMDRAGAQIVSTEMIIFELLKEAGTDKFRAILPLIK